MNNGSRGFLSGLLAAALVLQNSPLSAAVLSKISLRGNGGVPASFAARGPAASRDLRLPPSSAMPGLGAAALNGRIPAAPRPSLPLGRIGQAIPPLAGLPSSALSAAAQPVAAGGGTARGAQYPMPAVFSDAAQPAAHDLPAPGPGLHPELEGEIWGHAAAQGFARGVRTDAVVPVPALPESEPSGLAAAWDAAAAVRKQVPAPAKSERRTVAGILGSVFAAELWLEAGALLFPFIAQTVSGSFLSVAVLSSASVGASALGSMIGGKIVDRFGIRTMYVAGLIARTGAATAMFAAYASGAIVLPVLAGLFALDSLLTAANRIAEEAAPAAIYGGNVLKVNRFGAWKQRCIEAAGVIGPLLVGHAVAAAGFTSALGIFAGILALGAILAVLTVRPPPAKVKGRPGGFGAAIQELIRNPALRWPALAFGLITAINLWLYLMVGQAFSLHVTGSAKTAAEVMGWLTGLFCSGGLLGTWLSEKFSTRMGKRVSSAAALGSDRDGGALGRDFAASTRRWIKASAWSLLGVWAFLLPALLPGLPAAFLAIIPIGIALGGAVVQTESLVKTAAPARLRGAILGVISAMACAAAAVGFFPMGLLFDYFSKAAVPTSAAVAVMGAAATLLASIFVFISKRVVPPRPAQARPEEPES